MCRTKKYLILLVEDNEGDAVLAREALAHNGSESRIVHLYNGDQALEYLYEEKNPRPDVILLDLNLPGMTGLEILQILKNEPKTESLPVIVFSTSNSESDINSCYRYKASEYITKPMDLGDFFDVFKSIDEFMKKNDERRCKNG